MRSFLTNNMQRFSQFWWGDRGLSTFLFLLFVIFFISPFIDSHLADLLISMFLFLLLVSGIANVTERKLFQIGASVVAGAAMIFNVLHQVFPGKGMNAWWHLFAIAYFFLLIWVLLNQVFRAGPVTAHRVRGAVAVYLLIGLTWAFIYQLIALVIPGAMSFPASMAAQPGEPEYESSLTYFSFVTMTTLGYGDIVPVSPVARVFVIMEALIGQLYPATLLARLVSLEISGKGDRTPPA